MKRNNPNEIPIKLNDFPFLSYPYFFLDFPPLNFFDFLSHFLIRKSTYKICSSDCLFSPFYDLKSRKTSNFRY
jgi:hypothetical protein